MADQINTQEEREKFEAWREKEPWYTVAKAAADDDDPHSDAASIFRMMNIAASEAWRAGRALLSASQPVAGQGWMPTYSGWLWTHNARGGEYRMIGAGKLQTDKPLRDMAEVVLYQGEDGRLWVRAADEWDGRFKRLRPDPAFVGAALSQPSAGTAGGADVDGGRKE